MKLRVYWTTRFNRQL